MFQIREANRNAITRLKTTTALAGTVAVLLSANTAYALPTGGLVSAGSASISSSGSQTTITQSSGRAVIDWSSFNVENGETVQFVQPSATSVALNRIHDTSASEIYGALNANGQVWLLNANGIVFGKGSQVNVGGLIATTANISNSNFMAGNNSFDTPGSPGSWHRQCRQHHCGGRRDAGFCCASVVNTGVINAHLGKVTLASGDTFALDMYGDGLINLAVSPEVTAQLVANSGLIQDNGGGVLLTAAAGSQIVNSLIDNTGIIGAQSAGVNQDGSIELYAEGSNAVTGNVTAGKGQKSGGSTVINSGILDASGYGAGETGGTISVLADNVGILSGSFIDASGDVGGGTIRIGGDFHGAGRYAHGDQHLRRCKQPHPRQRQHQRRRRKCGGMERWRHLVLRQHHG